MMHGLKQMFRPDDAVAQQQPAPRFAATLFALLLPAFAAVLGTALADVATRTDAELKAALAARPDAARGAALYGTCAACHGSDGGGVADGSIPVFLYAPAGQDGPTFLMTGNYLVLKGNLGADKARLLAQVRQAIERPHSAQLRQEWQRGL